jgi:hypothetical protein
MFLIRTGLCTTVFSYTVGGGRANNLGKITCGCQPFFVPAHTGGIKLPILLANTFNTGRHGRQMSQRDSTRSTKSETVVNDCPSTAVKYLLDPGMQEVAHYKLRQLTISQSSAIQVNGVDTSVTVREFQIDFPF